MIAKNLIFLSEAVLEALIIGHRNTFITHQKTLLVVRLFLSTDQFLSKRSILSPVILLHSIHYGSPSLNTY